MIEIGDTVEIVAGRYAGHDAIVDEIVGSKSAYVFIVDTHSYATVRMSSLEVTS